MHGSVSSEEEATELKIIKNNENIIRRKLHILQRNQSVRRHLSTLSTPKTGHKVEPYSRVATADSPLRPSTMKSALGSRQDHRPRLFASESRHTSKLDSSPYPAKAQLSTLQSFAKLSDADPRSSSPGTQRLQGSLMHIPDASPDSSPTLKGAQSIRSIELGLNPVRSRKHKRTITLTRINIRSRTRKFTKSKQADLPTRASIARSVYFEDQQDYNPEDLELNEVSIKQLDLSNSTPTPSVSSNVSR